MNPDEIKVDHCYSMRPVNGRRIIVRVTKLFDTTRMARGETDSATMTTTVVRFVWRYAAYPTGWSTRQQQLRLADFALGAEEDVACS